MIENISSKKTQMRLRFVLTLIWVGKGGRGGNFTLSPCWFSLNNSKMVKAATLAFCSIQLHLIRDVHAKLAFVTRPSLQILGKTQTQTQYWAKTIPYKKKLS